jgi:hypothetical protein
MIARRQPLRRSQKPIARRSRIPVRRATERALLIQKCDALVRRIVLRPGAICINCNLLYPEDPAHYVPRGRHELRHSLINVQPAHRRCHDMFHANIEIHRTAMLRTVGINGVAMIEAVWNGPVRQTTVVEYRRRLELLREEARHVLGRTY